MRHGNSTNAYIVIALSTLLTSNYALADTTNYKGYVVNCSSFTAETHDSGFPESVRNASHGCHIEMVNTTLKVPGEVTYRTPSGSCTMVYSLNPYGNINITLDDNLGNITCEKTVRNNMIGFDIVDVN